MSFIFYIFFVKPSFADNNYLVFRQKHERLLWGAADREFIGECLNVVNV